jgi:glycosyltransferase involved in cell wall biosynthesis
MEMVLIESNSTDGTREIVRSYEGKAGVRVIWEDRPQGKAMPFGQGWLPLGGTLF